MKYPVVFTDLDGTLLDHASYSYDSALPALQMLRDQQIPLVLCSSKTRTEIEYYRRLLDNRDPFVTENGGGIYIPEGYFDLSTLSPDLVTSKDAGYVIIRLGAPYQSLRQAVKELQSEGFALTGFGDMTIAAVAELTGLTLEQAAMAKIRDFDEPFVFDGSEGEVVDLDARIRQKGFFSTRGAFFHLLGDSNKGSAMEILTSLFREKLGMIFVVALGDALNDLPMLQHADFPVAIKKPNGCYDQNLILSALFKSQGIGPTGWNEAIFHLFGSTW